MRSQDLVLTDDLQGEAASQYTPGSALRDHDSSGDGWRSKLMSLRERGFERMGNMREKMGTMRETMSSKVGSMHESTMSRLSTVCDGVSSRMSTMRDGVSSKVDGAGRNLRAHPAKWAGIAAGAGAGIGLAGRMMRARAARRRTLPTLVIIEAC